jgi:N-acetylmuramoyl-L-alanine amidase
VGETTAGRHVQEKDVSLGVGLALQKSLQASGYTVLMSRVSDSPVAQLGPGDTDANGFTAAGEHKDTAARVQCANSLPANLLVAIHLNSFVDQSTGGSETVYDSAREFAADNQRFAGLLQKNLTQAFSAKGWAVPDRGVKDDGDLSAPAFTAAAQNYGHLLELGPAKAGFLDDPSKMPGALTEPLFVTDRNEADVAVSKGGQEAMASGIKQAVDDYFSASAR